MCIVVVVVVVVLVDVVVVFGGGGASSFLFWRHPSISVCHTFLRTSFTYRIGVVGDPGTTAVTGALTSARVAEAVAR